MKNYKILLTITFFLIISALYAQKSNKVTQALFERIEEKGISNEYTVWIFFTDKGDNLTQKLVVANQTLSQRSLERRKKLLKNKPLVTFYDIPVLESYIEEISPFLLKLRHSSKWLNAVSAEVSGQQLNEIANLDFVKSIDIVRSRKYDKELANEAMSSGGNNTKNTTYNLNYGPSITQLEQINVPMIHDMGYSGDGIIICVLDAGFNNLEHQSFSSMNILDAYDFVNDDPNVDDEGDMGSGSHGTMTLSTIGGFYEGQLIGPAYGASYLLAKTENTDSETQVEEDNWVAGAQWAEALGAEITSTSLGYIYFDDGTGYDPSDMDGNTAVITIAADIMASLGVLVVNSAGNSGGGTTTIGAPADGNEVLAVGAVNSDGTRSSFSSVGPTADGRIKPEVMAMGSGVVVANTSGNTYTTASGTSFSCPLTAGAAALLWEMVPMASNMEIFEALKMSANNASNPNNYYGWGIIDIYAAYQYLALPQIESIPLSDTENLSGPYTVTAEVTSNYDLVAGSPKVYYRVDGGAWTNIVMSLSGVDIFTANIPGNGSSGNYDYYITAENDNALVSLPEDAPNTYFSFSVETDTEAPQIIHNIIAEYYQNLWGYAQVIAELKDNIGIDTSNSFVEWKINGNSQTNIYFTNTGENNYSASFPYANLSLGDLIEYRLIVRDSSSGQNTTTFPTSGFQGFNITDRISFEQNKFSHNWNFSGNEDWFVSSTESQDGSYGGQSGNIGDSQKSTISIDFSCDVAGTISFYKKVSSEPNYDYLKFYINGNLQDEWSGEDTWSEETYSASIGSYNLKWEYSKDVSVSNGSDAAWIDNITFPGNSSMAVTDIATNPIKIFPNPAQDIIYIDLQDAINLSLIEIFNQTGKIIKKVNSYQNRSAINLSNLANGIYICKIRTDKTVEFAKFIIAK